ncbi:acyl-CoA dehydrogenase [Bacillus canaveralius]|uniref:Acyl-CoA dehydrogenase n=1 Tax=Bacillus canaveralius TaxID=1403243 RepID=A0A2N5GIG8_9BACI|nr:acyl-CoA dehydrogenase family protein [Bacillus canaveralius]PLR80787.1 acyl-CoA dehydrogenase [Bacillus canaveralius]PLR98335.1 acyl-CoA dehydrogenase [Bacillus canaveralius]
MNFAELKGTDERLKCMDSLKEDFSERANRNNDSGEFPFQNFDDLKRTGYTALTVSQEYGGKEISLYELVRLQEKIAEGDGSTALGIGWHMGIIKNLSEKRLWDESLFQFLCEEVKKGAIINAAATEPGTGSPTRGGKPQTTAEKQGQTWTINGRKTFTTLAPVLDFFIVTATLKESEEIANFLIPRSASGLRIEETWDSISMRGTGSHDLILENVIVEDQFLVEKLGKSGQRANGWLLHIPACYLGIAQAAQSHAIKFSQSYSPNSIDGSIIDLPNVRQKIGEIELELMRSRHFLYSVAKLWDESDENKRNGLLPELGAVKHAVTNSAIKAVDLAMRVVGARSLSAKSPLQRYYRDVRAGLHNPPMDDMTINLLAQHAIQVQKK